WILGFNAKCESTSPIHSELLAFRQALHITMQGNFIPCEIETDATEVIRFLEEDYPTYKSFLDECRYLMEKLMERGETRMKHNFREGNKVAHLLAKEALFQPTYNITSFLREPPNFVENMYYKDKEGRNNVRECTLLACNILASLGNDNALSGIVQVCN
ncbi:hypothetical protein A4A49_62761, partial [Nicotiana attenuata]